MNIFDTKDTPRTNDQYSGVLQNAAEVVLLRETLSRLGVNGRHIHVLHGETGLLALSTRTARPDLITQGLNFLLNRAPAGSDFSAEIEALQQGARIVTVDLPHDPTLRERVKAAFRDAGATGLGVLVQPDSDRPQRRASPLTA